MIEMYLLEQLVAFAQTGTLSGASEKLHISQPALSNSMKKIEDILGVSLFERKSNRLVLNENGKLAVKLAEDILAREREMEERIRRLDRSRHTITIASCAPVPLWNLAPMITEIYDGMAVSSQLFKNNEEIIKGVKDGAYTIGVIHGDVQGDEDIEKIPFGKEKLFLVVPYEHPLAQKDKITGKDIDGQNLLLYSNIGFWYSLVKKELPNAHFLMMDDYDVFGSIAETEAFPSFVTDASLQERAAPKGKKILEIDESYATTEYHLIWQKKNYSFLKPLIEKSH